MPAVDRRAHREDSGVADVTNQDRNRTPLWVTLGERPNVLDALGKLYAGLTGERPHFKDAEDASISLAERLEHKNCLIVIDDVWAAELLTTSCEGPEVVRTS